MNMGEAMKGSASKNGKISRITIAACGQLLIHLIYVYHNHWIIPAVAQESTLLHICSQYPIIFVLSQ